MNDNITASLYEIVLKLIERTEQNSVEWEETPTGYEYAMPDSLIKLTMIPDSFGMIFNITNL